MDREQKGAKGKEKSRCEEGVASREKVESRRLNTQTAGFYRVMHYSAKRGLAIACRLSVRLSVTLVDQDHIG